MTNQTETNYELLSRGEREAIDNMRSKGFAICVVSPQDLTDSRKSLDDMEMMLQQVMLDAIHAAPYEMGGGVSFYVRERAGCAYQAWHWDHSSGIKSLLAETHTRAEAAAIVRKNGEDHERRVQS